MRISRDPILRGCGSRKKGGAYACCGVTDGPGLPLEAFMIDPVTKYEGECFRAPLVVPDPNRPGIFHLAIWVGAEFYPSPVDYLEETRKLGASRRIPEDFDVSVLTPGASRMILIHPRAFTQRKFEPASCPRGLDGHGVEEACLGAHWHYLDTMGSKRIEAGRYEIGQVTYSADPVQQEVDKQEFSPGMFLQLPITHLEYEALDSKDTGPQTLKDRAAAKGIDYVIVDTND